MLKIAENKRRLSGLRVARRAPPVSHLLFADDSMIYCRGTDEAELSRVTDLLNRYSLASGQRINYDKSSVYFGKNIPVGTREEIKRQLGIEKTGGEGFYLGLPESFRGAKVSILSYLKENLSQRIHGWQMKFLSPAGKEVLLKAVAMALPTYTMSCFMLPKTVCKQIMAALADFWWRNNQDSRGMHWMSWESLCRPKSGGGLGFKDLEAFNLALLGKQLWRMITNKSSLVAQVFKSRYFKNSDPLNAPLGTRPSFAWRSIHAAQNLVQQGAKMMIGNGKETKVWSDRWIGSKPAQPVTTLRLRTDGSRECLADDMKVSELLCGNGREWNLELLDRLFTPEVREQIKSVHPAGRSGSDTYSWEYTKSGHYTVKSAYWVQVNVIDAMQKEQRVLQPSLDEIYKRVWSLETSPKVRHFLWRCLSNALPVAANMVHRHIAKDKRCGRCGGEVESVNHLLFQCPYARLIWAEANVHIPPSGRWSDSFFSNLHWVLNLKKEYPREEIEEDLVPWLMWRVWKNRNELLFRSKEYTAIATVLKAREDATSWRSREEVKMEEVIKPMIEETPKIWSPPQGTRLKCNTDGSWKKESGEGGVGWILRDSSGSLLWAGAKRVDGLGSELEVEAEALRWAAYTLAGFGYKRLIFESDSQVLVRMVNGEDETWPRVKPIIQEISSSLAGIIDVELVYYPRSGNKVADRIAKETATFSSFVPRLYSMVPNWLVSCMEVDMNFVRV